MQDHNTKLYQDLRSLGKLNEFFFSSLSIKHGFISSDCEQKEITISSIMYLRSFFFMVDFFNSELGERVCGVVGKCLHKASDFIPQICKNYAAWCLILNKG